MCVCSASACCPRGVCRGRGGRSRLSRAARIRFCCAQRRAAAESKLSARRMRRSAFRGRSQGWGSSCNGRGGGAAVARQAGRHRQAGRRLASGPAGPRTLQSCPHRCPVRPTPRRETDRRRNHRSGRCSGCGSYVSAARHRVVPHLGPGYA